MQGLQRTDQLLNVIKSQLPSIAQASEMHGVNLIEFLNGSVNRSGVQLDPAIAGVTAAIVALIGPPTVQPTVQPGVMSNDHSANIVMDAGG